MKIGKIECVQGKDLQKEKMLDGFMGCMEDNHQSIVSKHRPDVSVEEHDLLRGSTLCDDVVDHYNMMNNDDDE